MGQYFRCVQQDGQAADKFSMNSQAALLKKVCQSLEVGVLPFLREICGREDLSSQSVEISEQTLAVVREAQELLGLVEPLLGATVGLVTKGEQASAAMSDEEALALMADMDELSAVIPPHPAESEDKADLREFTEIAAVFSGGLLDEGELAKEFFLQAAELLFSLNESLLELEKSPRSIKSIEAVFRAVHTLKGSAAMFDLRIFVELAHSLEEYFDQVQKKQRLANSEDLDVVLIIVDFLQKELAAVSRMEISGIANLPFQIAIERVRTGQRLTVEELAAIQPVLAESGEKHAISSIRVEVALLDALLSSVAELVADKAKLLRAEEIIREQGSHHLTAMMSEIVQSFSRNSYAIQESVMEIRMVPIGGAFRRFPRIVRDLSRSLGKEIELVLEGEENKLDKAMVENLVDPLTHMIRNSVDHAIETKEVRLAAKKSAVGTIALGAMQRGNHIIVTIKDDGRGMDIEKIRSRAIERGLIKNDKKLSESEILQLIFLPGFSTAESVTQLSGRGVGMDVVRQDIEAMEGRINISSTLGQGSAIEVELPLTLAIFKSMLVGVEGKTFALPIQMVSEFIRIERDRVENLAGFDMVCIHDKPLPVIELAKIITPKDAFGATVETSKNSKYWFLVIFELSEVRFGLLVDSILGQAELVVKPLGKLLANTRNFAGAAVLASGEVILVVDLPEVKANLAMMGQSFVEEFVDGG